MPVPLLALAFQLQAAALASAAPHTGTKAFADSSATLRRAKFEQISFERNRRIHLPLGASGGGRCDARVGRFCWWYDDQEPTFPPEAEVIGRRRAELLATLDEANAAYPGDEWLTGMRVHYRVDGHDFAGADSAAQSCHASAWWCSALVGYASHARGDGARADSAFSQAIESMPSDTACRWRNIALLLAGNDRDAYEHSSCDARRNMEQRYWLLSRPQLASDANEWKNEFFVRRVLTWLAERAATPQGMSWGDDAAELLLRYGWPTAWSRIERSAMSSGAEVGIIGHDPSPSFAFAPAFSIADTTGSPPAEAWDLSDRGAQARYAPRRVRRTAAVSAQVARFRRGDSTLVVAAYAAVDDSLRAPRSALAVAGADGLPRVSAPDSSRAGWSRVMMGTAPLLVGVELSDTSTRTLARMRAGFAGASDSARLSLSDLLVYRVGDAPAESLDSALARAIPGDTASRTRPIGLFWETYGLASDAETVDLAVMVERIDHGWLRSARQRMGITPQDAPIRVRWTDTRPPANRATAHAISLDLGKLEPGRYQVTLTLTPATGSAVSASREISLLER
jgi:hypothetical protein